MELTAFERLVEKIEREENATDLKINLSKTTEMWIRKLCEVIDEIQFDQQTELENKQDDDETVDWYQPDEEWDDLYDN